MLKRIIALVVCLISAAVGARAQRLPGNVLPESYEITLEPDLRAAKFTGEETIRVRLLAETPSITLNAAEIEFRQTSVSAGGQSQNAAVSLDPKQEQATLTFPQAVPAGKAEIHIKFAGILNDQLRGFYLVKGKTRNRAATQFEATDARRAFPCFDEPAMKATFTLRLVLDAGDTAISNSKVVSDTPGPGEGKHALAFAPTPKMSSYLVAMAVGDFACVEGSADQVPIRVCATPDQKELGRFALEAAKHILQYYDNYYSIKYPYDKLDIVAIPDFAAGAMENTAAIFYRESLLLVDDRHSSVRAHQFVASILAHEMAHMWFGDLVTMQWWNDLWLNEGFATWMAPKPVAAWKPEWHADVDAVQESVAALNQDSYDAVHAVRTQADTPDQILELADEITYGKAADVLRMVEAYVGEETFRRGVNTYLQEHAYGNATAEDFWNTLARVSGRPVDKIMASFVDQPGTPVISLRMKPEAGSTRVELAQQRFFNNRQKMAAVSGELWQVPVCLRGPAPAGGGEAAVTCELLASRSQAFTVPGAFPWLMINAGARGYYRSSYEPQALAKISAAAEKELSPGERLMLLVDGWSMVRSGKLDIGDYLATLEGFKSERQAAVTARLGGILRDIAVDLAPGSEAEPYRAWVRQLLKPAAEELGWTPAPGESDDRRSLRSSVIYTLGFVGRDSETLSKSHDLIEKYFQDPAGLDPSMANTVARLAALEGDRTLYDQYLAQLKKSKTPEEYDRFLYSLASFSDPALLIRTIEYALSGEVRIQNAPFLVGAVLQNPDGRPATWNYVKEHWAVVEPKLPAFAAGPLVDSAGTVCDAASRDNVQSFFASNKLPAAERTIRQTLERMDQCVDLRSRQESKLAEWLVGRKIAAGQ